MRSLAVLLALAATIAASCTQPPLPLASGRYTFQHRYAEQPDIPGFPVTATIDGNHIVLVNESPSDAFPAGVIAEGTLMWNAKAGHWVIGHDDADRETDEVGGCSDGPEMVDFDEKIYWTC